MELTLTDKKLIANALLAYGKSLCLTAQLETGEAQKATDSMLDRVTELYEEFNNPE